MVLNKSMPIKVTSCLIKNVRSRLRRDPHFGLVVLAGRIANQTAYSVMRASNDFTLNAKICPLQILTFKKMLLLHTHVTTVLILR